MFRGRRMMTHRNRQKKHKQAQQKQADQQQQPFLHDRLTAGTEAGLQPTQGGEIGALLLRAPATSCAGLTARELALRAMS